jgi:hypothetical protein
LASKLSENVGSLMRSASSAQICSMLLLLRFLLSTRVCSVCTRFLQNFFFCHGVPQPYAQLHSLGFLYVHFTESSSAVAVPHSARFPIQLKLETALKLIDL